MPLFQVREKVVFLPVEMAHRELESKFLLAVELCKRGYVVKLGTKKSVFEYLRLIQGGIFLSIWSAHKKFCELYKSLQSNHTRVVAMDEEAVITMGEKVYSNTRINQGTLEYIDLYLACGVRDADIIKSKVGDRCQVQITGNPRFDLLRMFNSNFLHSDKSKILLISPFGFGNHYIGFDNYMHQLETLNVLSGPDLIAYRKYGEVQIKNMRAFISLAKAALSTISNEYSVVYRPHPAENVEYLKSQFSETNVQLSLSSSLIDDLASASLIVHNFCTVGVEAKVMGLNTLGYSPYSYDIADESIVYEDVPFTQSHEIALEYISTASNNLTFVRPKNLQDSSPSLEPVLADLSGRYAFERIADELDLLQCDELKLNASLYQLAKYLIRRIYTLVFSKSMRYFKHRNSFLTQFNIKKLLNIHSRRVKVNLAYSRLFNIYTLSAHP